MQMGMREWLMVVGALLIAFILFDGWRRMRRRELDRRRFDLDRRFSFSEPNEKPPAQKHKAPAKVTPIIEPAEEEPLLPSLHIEDNAHHHSALPQQETETKAQTVASEQAPPEAKSDADVDVNESQPASDELHIEDVLVIFVRSKNEKGFFGPTLLQCILESGLRFGERDIFHRHESKAGSGEVLFSMANAVNPGTFDLAEMDHCHIRAVAFYLILPGPRHAKAAFNEMLVAARKLETELGGEIKDDQHSVLTAQTIEHYRRRIAEFERKKLLNR